ncbi:hypothetical protein CLV78_101251 [Aliiruegeria haliotis]|uniref:Uncharacterized protein n=1 Tax=Aliiruegeria haliotis TaxID=1280846 RepID=A0A2T0RYB7_9RHOB|nr:phage holin family protein [Aliiruegeria haliotis]PRY26157.1 hypothetical protein CLV78_101251 [Aliiruegeria haliotis]
MGKNLSRARTRVARNLSVAMRAERVITRRRMAVLRSQTTLVAFAGLIAGIGVVMVNVGAFYWIAASLGKAAAGGIVALVNFGLAGVLALIAGRMSAEAELEPVIEVRDLAVEDIEAEVSDALSEVGEMADTLRRMARDPVGSAMPNLLAPLLSILLKSLRK